MIELRMALELDEMRLDLDVRCSERVVGIFGPSGAGKSSLLECVAGLRRRTTGRIVVAGECWLDSEVGLFVPPERRGVGYVPQDGLLFPHLDVLGNLSAGAAHRQRNAAAAGELDHVVALLELDGLLDRRVDSLSGGERQRVALARAVASAPRLLLLDEPLASLDLALRRRILPFLRRLRDELDLPMLYVSHDPTEVLALCDEVLALDRGRCEAQGTPAEVLADPALYSIEEDRGFENVVLGEALAASPGEGGVVLLDPGEQGRPAPERPGLQLRTPYFPDAAGTALVVVIPAQQVLLAAVPPRQLSAQNCLEGEVVGLRSAGGVCLVTVRFAGSAVRIVAELTSRAATELELEAGSPVFAVIKQTGCRVYGAGGASPAH
jgi:molybdate transport system ATP-binding protein